MTSDSGQSTDYFEIAFGDVRMSCLARPRSQWGLWIFTGIVLFFCLFPLWWIVSAMMPGSRSKFENLSSGIGGLIPMAGAVAVLMVMIRRANNKRGIEIAAGTVTLYTPDSTRSRHAFDLNELKGATLTGKGSAATLNIGLRRGGSIPLFIGVPIVDAGIAMDAINRMVVDNRYHAFEVIPLTTVPIAAVAVEPLSKPPPDRL